MNFDDELRSLMKKAETSMPVTRAADWEDTMASARRKKLMFAVATAAGVTAVAVIGFAFANRLADETPSIAPAGTPTATVEETTDPTPSPEPEPKCSIEAVGNIMPIPQEGLPEPVVQMREAIVDLASNCDFEGLEALALEGEEGFSYSFGSDRSPARFWRMLEEGREYVLIRPAPMEALVLSLNLPYCEERISAKGGRERVIYAWPSVQCADRTDEDWEHVEGLYTNKQISQMKEFDLYFGYRAGITEDGDLIYFVAGD